MSDMFAGMDTLSGTEVEVGDTNLAPATEAPKTEAETKAEDEPPVETDEEPKAEGEEASSEADEEPKPKPKSHKDYQIERLKREKAEEKAAKLELEARIQRLEQGLTPPQNDASPANSDTAPDPSDIEKYPLGHLDSRYVEDQIAYRVSQTLAQQSEAGLQRQQETEQRQALLKKVDDLVVKGSSSIPDFREQVYETAMRGDWNLDAPTFEAAHEAENGFRILHELSQNPTEAARVASLSPFQQVQYVAKRDQELAKASKPRTVPQAGEPPQSTTRGANSRTVINPATDNLDDFEKLWNRK